jgi:hypothetical protein
LLAQLQGSACGAEVVGVTANFEHAEILSIAEALRKRLAAFGRQPLHEQRGAIPAVVHKVSVSHGREAQQWWFSALHYGLLNRGVVAGLGGLGESWS